MDKQKAKKIRQALRKAGLVPVNIEGENKWKVRAGKSRDAKPLSIAFNKIKGKV